MASSCTAAPIEQSARRRPPGDALFGFAVAIVGAGTLWGVVLAVALAWFR